MLPTHPTIRSVTIRSDSPSRAVELAGYSIEKLVQIAPWRELKLSFTEDSVHNFIFEKICRSLSANTTITTLDLVNCPLKQSGVDELRRLFETNNTITSLFMDVDNKANLTSLATALELQKQLVAFGILSDINEPHWTSLIRALKANPSLTFLEIHPEIPEGSTRDLVDIIHHNRLKILDADFWHEDIDTVCTALLANTSLTSLELGGIAVSNCDLLSEVIKVHPTLQRLAFPYDCDLDDKMSLIIDALKCNKTITYWDIGQCLFTNSWSEFRDLFKSNTMLQHWAVSDKCIQEDDWKYLGEILQSTKTLKSFRYKGGIPQDEYFEVICHALKINQSLTSVTIDETLSEELTDWQLKTLLTALTTNNTLLTLSITASQLNIATYGATLYDLVPNIETLELNSVNMEVQFIQKFRQISHDRKLVKRRAITDLVVLLFNIARRPESLELFPREIWLTIFDHIHSPYLDVGCAAAIIFEDTTLRTIIQFDRDALYPIRYCHFDEDEWVMASL